MDYKKKTLQLIYSEYEQMVEIKERYFKEIELFVVVKMDKLGDILYDSIKNEKSNTILLLDEDVENEINNLQEQFLKYRSCVVFPYFCKEFDGKKIFQNFSCDIIENGMEYFAYRIDSSLKECSLFDIGSNGMAMALDCMGDDDSCKIAYNKTLKVISLDNQSNEYEIINNNISCVNNEMIISGNSIHLVDDILEEVLRRENELKRDKPKCIIPLGYKFSYLWKIPICIKKIQPMYKMKLIQCGNRFDETYLIIGVEDE